MTAYVFIGAAVPDDHFYTKGKEIRACRKHGEQPGKYCGDCGDKTVSEFEKKRWTLEMKRAARVYGITPEKLWDQLTGGEDETVLYYHDNRGNLGRWCFDEKDRVLFGTAITCSDDDGIDLDELTGYLSDIRYDFKNFGIELPVKLFAI